MRAALIGGVIATVFAGAALAAPARDALVRPGVSVGKVKLGMTEAQLRSAMGAPDYVLRKRGSFGRFTVQFQYGARSEWVVDLTGPRGATRVVSVTTFVRSQRLPNGFGPGTRELTIRRAYGSRLVCPRWPTYVFQGVTFLEPAQTRTCTLAGPRGTATIFVSRVDVPQAKPGNIDPHARVFEIGVRTASR